MRLVSMFLILIVSLISFSVFGQDVPEDVQSIGDKILSILESAGGATVAITLILEFLFRSVKSKKPLSIIRSISATLRYVFSVILSVLDFIDKVIPQNVDDKESLNIKKKF